MNKIRVRPFARLAAIAILGVSAFCAGPRALAQSAQGTILGHVTDPTGAVVAGAKITVKNLDTGVINTFSTTNIGDYVIPQLDPGTYSVTVAATGFKPEVSNGLIVEVDHTLRQDFKLTVGTFAETMTVTADTQMLQTDNPTIGQVISGSLMEDLPLNGRDFTSLLLIGVGTSITPGGSQVSGFSVHAMNQNFTEVSINGAHADSISYNIDGVYDSDFFFSAPMNIPSELSIQEFKMMNGQYGAQYGQGSAQVNVAIKSGTNDLHGAAYEFIQNDFFNPDNQKYIAENKLEGASLNPHPPYKQNQFGGTFSGPITVPRLYSGKDKTFFFASYDGGRLHQSVPQNPFVVPTAKELTGDFSDWSYPIYNPATTGAVTATPANPTGRKVFSGNKLTGAIDPTAQKILAYFNKPTSTTCTDLTSGCYNFAGAAVNTLNTNIETARFDQDFNTGDRISLTGNLGDDAQVNPSLKYGQGNTLYARTKLIGATWTRPFSPKTLNQATLGYTREHFFTGQTTAYGPNASQLVGFTNTNQNPATYDLPNVCFSGTPYSCIGGGAPTTFVDNIYQGVDTLTLIRGRHTLNLGVDFRRIQLKELDNYTGTGSLQFNGEYTAANPNDSGADLPDGGNAFADFLLGYTSNASGPPPLGTDAYDLWGSNWNLFAQDDFRLTERLTLNLGLRYERPAGLHSSNSSGYAFDPTNNGGFKWASQSFVTPILATGGNSNWLRCCADNTLVHIDNKDFAPRFGFAYRPNLLGDKLVVRGGYGIFYDTYNRYYDGSQFDDNSLYTQFAAPYTNGSGYEIASPNVLSKLWSAPISSAAAFSSSLPVYNFMVGGNGNQVNWPGNRNPYNQQWSQDVEYALKPTLMLDAAYVGAHGVHQSTQIYFNSGVLPTVANDPCNSYFTAALAIAGQASCATDTNMQPIMTRVPYSNMPNTTYANANWFDSSYNALQVQLIQRPLKGLQYHLNYTWSKSMDVSSGINNINGEPGIVQDPFNPKKQYGLSASDQTHRLVGTYAYQLPAGPGTMLDVKGINWLIGGWTTSGVYQLASGFPFAILGNPAVDQMSGCGPGCYLADYSGSSTSGFKRSLSQWVDPAKYSRTVTGRYGDTNKSPERGPFFTNFDASFGKTTKLANRQTLMFRVEFFNLGSTWHSNTGLLFPHSTVTDPTFGTLIDTTIGDVSLWNPRKIQFGAQYKF